MWLGWAAVAFRPLIHLTGCGKREVLRGSFGINRHVAIVCLCWFLDGEANFGFEGFTDISLVTSRCNSGQRFIVPQEIAIFNNLNFGTIF